MDRTTSPSQKLAARLAARQAAEPRRARDAGHFIRIAESRFNNPTDIISIKWYKHHAGKITYGRAVHQFSDYERFIFLFAEVLEGLGRIEPALAHELRAAAVYSDGRAVIDNSSGELDESGFEFLKRQYKNGAVHMLPSSLNVFADAINQLIGQQYGPTVPGALTEWLARYVGDPRERSADVSSLFSSNPGPYALPLGVAPDTGQRIYYTGEASLLTIAAPGKGKTQCHVLPTLACYQGPAIVLDVKGECLRLTGEMRRNNVGPVIVFNPVSPEDSASYNPLAFVRNDAEELWQDARFLSDLLIVSRGTYHDPVWETQGRDLLTLFIAFVVRMKPRASARMSDILDLVAGVDQESMFEVVAEPANGAPSAMRRTAARFLQMSRSAPKQFEGVLSAISQHLQVWEGPKIESVTSALDWRPDDFRSSPYPTLYLCIPPNALDTYAPILRVIVAQHVRQLMRYEQRPTAPILFLLDELPRLGHMEPIRTALEVGRSYGIKLWMIAQYPEQISHAYPGVGDGMMESCDVRMYMNPSQGTAERICKAFGRSKSLFDGNKPVLDASDITSPTHRDSIFVLAANERPLILRKQYFHNG